MGPFGCIAQIIAYYGTDPLMLDEHGCVSSHNQAAIIFNLQIHERCKKLQSQYMEANVTYTDIFTIKFDLIVNYSRYVDAMGLPFLNPYLNAIGAPSFKNGCNFAASSCIVLPATAQSDCPFSFGIQVSQFLRLKAKDGKSRMPYLKSFLKKLIVEVESQGLEVLDELYERFAFYMTSLKGDYSAKANSRIVKCISFLFPDDCSDLPSCPKTRKLVVPLQCSLNMLEEFILSHPELFSNKSCFEVGSGVGLVGICLAHIKASKVMLSDGDLSSLANMKLNLELNHLSVRTDLSERTIEDPDLVKCIHLPWESAVGSELRDLLPDIILGADVMYDPLCLPNLVRVLACLLDREISDSHLCSEHCNGIQPVSKAHNAVNSRGSDTCQGEAVPDDDPNTEYACCASKEGPNAFIASVIRNIDTFNRFLELADEANLSAEDVTGKFMLFDLLPYMQSYNRLSIRLFTLTHF
ncbi:GDSL esterase/lipase [Camellia lanceoleosa]|uniref:GDSL esterase/lipase n=1 Tax=Camellia lanceoleosa TaxID=1840588 RepID=A0ACC0HPT1_9ERIC|nr:GDSL esterase/lipase [Camellia lanceoleosa]